MGRKLQFLAGRQVVGIILDKARSAFASLGHLHEHRRKCSDLVVAFRTEADALGHQVLGSDTRELLHAKEILEIVRKCGDLIFRDELLQGYFVSRLFTDCFHIVRRHRVFALIFSHFGIHFGIRCLGSALCDFADAPVLDFPAVLDVALQAVAVRHGHVAHIVAKGRDACIVGKADGLCHLSKAADFFHHMLMPVVTGHHFMRHLQLGQDEAVFAVTVGCLVEVHEVHVDAVIRKLLVVLRVQVKQRLPKDLQALDPHFCR